MRWALVPAVVLAVVASGAAGSAVTPQLVVTTASDEIDGNVMTVAGLLADPGPDGISLREAIEATNADPGAYTIRFAQALAGATITTGTPGPKAQLALTGGGVTIDGDIDGNGEPDVTLRPWSTSGNPTGLVIASSGNRLHALSLDGYHVGVRFQASWRLCCPGPGEYPTHHTFAGNSVSGLVMQHIGSAGISGGEYARPTCEIPPNALPCQSFNTWSDTTLSGNAIEAQEKGIVFDLHNGQADRLERLTLTDNAIRLTALNRGDGITVAAGGNSMQTQISDVVIARNSIEGVGSQLGITVIAGGQRAQANTIDGAQIVDNTIVTGSHAADDRPGVGIGITAGSDGPLLIYPQVQPVAYPDNNAISNVEVRGNTITGSLVIGLSLEAGTGAGGRRNRVEDVQISGNTMHSDHAGIGLNLSTGDGKPFRHRYATGNRIARVRVSGNGIVMGKFLGKGSPPFAAGLLVVGGGGFGHGNAVRDVQIKRNTISTPVLRMGKSKKNAYLGIELIGGFTPTAHANTVSCVRLSRNRVRGARKALSVRPNVQGASGNRATLGGC